MVVPLLNPETGEWAFPTPSMTQLTDPISYMNHTTPEMVGIQIALSSLSEVLPLLIGITALFFAFLILRLLIPID